MGLPMAVNLHKALAAQDNDGFQKQLLVWNRTASKAEPLRDAGAQQVADVAGKARSPDSKGALWCLPSVH